MFKSRVGEIEHCVASTSCHHSNIFSKEAVLSGRNDVVMGATNSLHSAVKYSEYNERFD